MTDAEWQWSVALDVARLAPTTGKAVLNSSTVIAVQAEREVLRAALNKIAERTGSDDPCRWMVELARQTLQRGI